MRISDWSSDVCSSDLTESADFEVLYGRAIARWWDLVAGVRHDFGEGPSQTFAGIGVIGLSPYKFEIEATAYVGESGQTAARLEAEYDTLITNRLKIGRAHVSTPVPTAHIVCRLLLETQHPLIMCNHN